MAFQSLLGFSFAGHRELMFLFISQGRFLIAVLVL